MFKHKVCLILFISTALIFNISIRQATSLFPTNTSIELERARWNKFPLKVLVNLNNWSNFSYAYAVHEALNSWVTSVQEYIFLTNDTTLKNVNFVFYINTVNLTNIYDVFITFTSDEIPPDSKIVGLTSYEWNPLTHIFIPPIIINITTYSGTADNIFIRNIVTHEFGHALGLGHSNSQYTSYGEAELMYATSSPTSKPIFPSTLDLYGLSQIYKSNYFQLVQLPSSIPYRMLGSGDSQLLLFNWDTFYIIILIAGILLLIIALVSIIPL